MAENNHMGMLRGVLQGVLAGEGASLVIAGDPGLGKTRLISECRRLFMTWVGAASGRLPLWLEGPRRFVFVRRPVRSVPTCPGLVGWSGPGRTRRDSQRGSGPGHKGASSDEPSQAHVELLSKVIFGSSKENDATAILTPEQTQRAIFGALREVVSRLVAHGPTVVVLEDLHWADPTSLHLTEKLATVAYDGPLLLLMTRRPEPDPGVSALEDALAVGQGAKFLRLDLGLFNFTAERELARALLGEGAPDDVVDLTTQGTDGNPLFLEERLSSLVDNRALIHAGNSWEVGKSGEAELPEALERLVLSRVDRMRRPPREVLMAASVLGAEFSFSSLASLSPVGQELRTTLRDLCSAGLITEVSGAADPTYRFRHTLIQDAAYKGLLREERRQLHGRVAWALEETSADRGEEVAGQAWTQFRRRRRG